LRGDPTARVFSWWQRPLAAPPVNRLISRPEPVGGTGEAGSVMSTFLAGEQPGKIVRGANRESVRLRVEVLVADAAVGTSPGGVLRDAVAGVLRPWAEQGVEAVLGLLQGAVGLDGPVVVAAQGYRRHP